MNARAVLLFLSLAVPATADDARPPLLRQVGIDQRLDAQVPLDLAFRDEAGRGVRLDTLVHDRPAILVFAYHRCPMLCPQVLNGLVSALGVLPFDVGKDVTLLTVSIDPRDTPAVAAEKKATLVKRYGRPGAAAGWHFLTGDAEPIAQLSTAVGFRYAPDTALDQYAHGAGLVVLTPDGRVSRYLFGVEFSPRDLRLALVEASAGRIGSFVDQLLLFCYHYDPVTGKYGAAVMNALRLGALLTVLALAASIVVMRRREGVA